MIRQAKKRVLHAACVLAAGMGVLACYAADEQHEWEVHDMSRPKPPVVTPGTFSSEQQPGKAPSDAIVLFDGSDLSKWNGEWKVENGYVEVVAKKGSLVTKDAFGDCQLHVEWMAPDPAKGSGQARGNSGIFLMSRYELQVLDSYNNETYADGQAAAIYGQHPPLVNASLPPGQWQTYDVVFRRPRFDESGNVVTPGRVTVFHNGVLAQDNVELQGSTAHKQRASYSRHPDRLPLSLQDHGDPVRFRNIWIRPLEK